MIHTLTDLEQRIKRAFSAAAPTQLLQMDHQCWVAGESSFSLSSAALLSSLLPYKPDGPDVVTAYSHCAGVSPVVTGDTLNQWTLHHWENIERTEQHTENMGRIQ